MSALAEATFTLLQAAVPLLILILAAGDPEAHHVHFGRPAHDGRGNAAPRQTVGRCFEGKKKKQNVMQYRLLL